MKHLDLRTPIWKKTIHVTTLFVLLAASRCVGAAWEGTDDFSSGISTTNWLIRPYLDAGQMLVAGTNGHASFIVPISASVEQNAGIVWKGLPAATNDWTADILGHNNAGWSANGRSEFKFLVLDIDLTGTPVGEFAIRMTLGATDSNDPYPRDFRTVYYPGPSGVVRQIAQTTATTFGLRLVHKGGLAGNIEAWYDPTGNGTTWTLLDTISVSSFSPSMTSTHSFGLEIMADCYYGPINEGDIWVDNFRIINSVPLPPPLVVAGAQWSAGIQQLNLKWMNTGNPFVVESSGTLTGGWSTVTTPWTTNANWVSTTATSSSVAQFYRLRAN